MLDWIKNHLRKHFVPLEKLERGPFLWRAWLETSVIAYFICAVMQFVFPAPPRTDVAGWTPLRLITLAAIAGPLVETLAFQCLPLELAASFGLRRGMRFVISIVPFALMHHLAGLPTMVAAGGVGGFYFAFTYERWRPESLVAAVVMTFLLHSSFNLVGILGIILFSQ
jgi:hypothetical protein